jgi:ribose 5-phosphate isomerase B
MKLSLGSDHAAFELRTWLAARLIEDGHEVEALGAEGPEPYDYPDASDLVAESVLAGRSQFGILLCGTGIGVSIRANRHMGIRAALCCGPDTARLAREHNDANVLCLGARTNAPEFALEIVRTFLKGTPSQEPRHRARVSKLDRPLAERADRDVSA